AVISIDSIGANIQRGNQSMREALRCGWTNQREPFSTQVAPGDKDVQVLALGKFHSNIYRACHYCDVMLQWEPTNYFCGGGPRSKSDDFPGFDECRRCPADPPLLVRKPLNLRLKGTIVAEWFVEKRLDRYGAAMRAPQ